MAWKLEQVHDKQLRPARSDEEYRLHTAALEWRPADRPSRELVTYEASGASLLPDETGVDGLTKYLYEKGDEIEGWGTSQSQSRSPTRAPMSCGWRSSDRCSEKSSGRWPSSPKSRQAVVRSSG